MILRAEGHECSQRVVYPAEVGFGVDFEDFFQLYAHKEGSADIIFTIQQEEYTCPELRSIFDVVDDSKVHAKTSRSGSKLGDKHRAIRNADEAQHALRAASSPCFELFTDKKNTNAI